MTGEERSSERMMEEEEEGVNDSERERERGKLIEWGYVRLMRTGIGKIWS